MAETPNYATNLPCFGDCQICNYTCYTTTDHFPFFFPPPPPPSLSLSSSQNHIAPFIIATVCVLGISFLLLLTCTVILRFSFKRRRGGGRGGGDSLMNNDDEQLIVDHPIWHIATVGLQQSVIDSITAFKYKKIDGFFIDGNNTTDCSVCLTEFEEGDDLRLLPKCNHSFHISCIDTWLRSHKTCPLCRSPIVNGTEGGAYGGNIGGGRLNSSVSSSGEVVLRVNMDDHDGGEGSTSSHQLRESGDNSGELPILEGVKIAEILSKNRELRVFSDLGSNHQFRRLGEGLEPIRRSMSLNAIDALAVCGAVVGNEGSSSDGTSNEEDGSSRVLEEEKIDSGKRGNKRGSSMSGLLWKKSSIGCSLQKAPLSLKRSLSARSKFFSFGRSRSQAPILPL